ncbi:MAG: hypothetical protein Q9175_002823 [Cornicularia normoerica]
MDKSYEIAFDAPDPGYGMGMVPRFQGPAHLTQLLHEYDFICHEPTAPSLPLVQLFFFRIYVRIRSHSHIAALAISFHSALVYSSTSRLRLVASLEYTKHSVAIFKMRISPLSIITCLLAAVAAQSGPTSNPPTTPPGFTATAGSSSTFTWTPTTSGTVTLTLRNGPAGDLNKGIVLASGIANSGSYTFTIPTGTASGAYTIEISSDSNASDANYSDDITVEGSNSIQSTSPSPSTLTTTTSSSTASSSSSSSDTSSSISSSDTSTTITKSETSTTSHTSTTKSLFSSSTSGATKSASSASGTSTPTSSTRTPTVSSKGANAGTVLGVNNGLLVVVLGILALF